VFALGGGTLEVVARAETGGAISGTVNDATGAVIPQATVTVINVRTDVRRIVVTNTVGVYAVTGLNPGSYEIQIEKLGFNVYRQSGIVLESGSTLLVDATLNIADKKESVTVTTGSVQLETASTQKGELITGKQATAVPLNGRGFTDLLALQPGVIPFTSVGAASVADEGASAFSPSGDLNPGTLSVSGQREYANGFTINGADAEEVVNMGTAIMPNLDSIAEFRMLTNNFDAEYGEYSGGQIDIVTKSGGNAFHGNAFEFLRNTVLDARNFFSPARATFQQNQFGGTLGGPIIQKKVFFFLDYQGTRMKQGVDSGLINVPSVQDRFGNLSDLASAFSRSVLVNGASITVPTIVNGQYWANLLSQKLGYTVSPGEPYYVPGCGSPLDCVLPNAIIPQSTWSAPAANLLPYIPKPNNGANRFTASSYDQVLDDNKGAIRIDLNTHWGDLTAYYFMDNYSLNSPYPTAQGGANVPGFNALTLGQSQLLSLSDTKTFGSTAMNEFHFSYTRDANQLGKPIGGVGPSLASQGFVTGPGTPGIVPLAPEIEGIENVVFNTYTIGVDTNGLRQVNNTFQWSDSFYKTVRNHTWKFGGEFHLDQVNGLPDVQHNGTFSFTGSETGSDFADFLLGVASQYSQGDAPSFYNRNRYVGAFAEDSWRVRQNVVLNYGLRWDVIMPWYEKYNRIQTLVPGQKSVVFPGAPVGLAFPGDPGVPRTLAPTRYNDFSPRIGLAYSPYIKQAPFRWLLGSGSKSSIHLGFGRFFTAIEGVTAGVLNADAPYGESYTSPAPPLFTTPFITASSGANVGQPFPLQFPPMNVSAKNPDANVNWSNYLPISGVPGYYRGNRTPYAEEYILSLERQFGTSTILNISYVGNQDHHLLVLLEANPGNPALCLGLSQPNQVLPGTPTCGPFGESGTYTTPSGQVVQGTRGPFGSAFGSNTYQVAMGNSNYNALQVTVRHVSESLEFLLGYTYGKSLDEASSLGELVNSTNYHLLYGLSAFDIRHNFVASYEYKLPLERVLRTKNRFTSGWTLTGITRFATGLPVTLYNNSDRSLVGVQPDGVNNFGVDEPQFTPGPLKLNHDPRNGTPYFNVSLFSLQPLGTPGNSPRRFFYGPGINNFDLALLKTMPLTESKSLQFRLESFNTFNHAQFYGGSSVDGNINSPTFGNVVSAAPPRLVQAGVKLTF
jgi:hypothetical protein